MNINLFVKIVSTIIAFIGQTNLCLLNAQKPITHTVNTIQNGLTPPSDENRTIYDLLNYPFGFINYNTSQSKMIEQLDSKFGMHKIVKSGFMRVPCVVVDKVNGYNYKYAGKAIEIAMCEHVKDDPDVYGYWYIWSFESKESAIAFAKKMVTDIGKLGIKLIVQKNDGYNAAKYNLKKFEHIGVTAGEGKDFPENINMPKFAVCLEICDPGRKCW